jgi:hypothetical protein
MAIAPGPLAAVTVPPPGHVAVQQRIGERRIARTALRSQLGVETTHLCFYGPTRVIGDRAYNGFINARAAKMSCTVDWMEPGVNKLRSYPTS